MRFLLSIGLLTALLANGSASAQSLDASASDDILATGVSHASSSPYIKRSWVGTEQWAQPDYKAAIYPFAQVENRSRRFEATGGLPPPAQAVDGKLLAVTLALNVLIDAAGAKEYFVKR